MPLPEHALTQKCLKLAIRLRTLPSFLQGFAKRFVDYPVRQACCRRSQYYRSGSGFLDISFGFADKVIPIGKLIRLDGKIAVDFDTARRLFTLICVLDIKG